MPADRKYEKLPGSGYASTRGIVVAGRPTRSYLGTDHLLVVEYPAPAQESYRRFPYEDIESIVIARRTGLGKRIVSLLLIVVLSIIGVFQANLFVYVMSWVVLVPFSVLLMLEIIKGPLCRTLIRTRVQEVELASCSRWRAGNRAVDLIEKRVRAAQKVETAIPPEVGLSSPEGNE